MSDRSRIQRGQIWTVHHEVRTPGIRAGGTVLVLQNDPYNRNASYPWIIVAAVGITSSDVPTHVPFQPQDIDTIEQDAGVRCERVGCIQKEWLLSCLGKTSPLTMRRVEKAIRYALALD